MDCPNCAHDNQDQARFCEACGKPLSRVCRSCSTALTVTARFCPQCGTPAEAEKTVRPASAPAPAPAAERRQLTVLFCDLVGSTALSASLDPEQLRELMRSYQQAAGAVFERYEGHVAQYLGDGLMVYFGWPRAHEDDAHRALHASLEIIQAVKSVKAPQPLQVRIGIATGPVVVGETGAGDASVPKLAVGETPNIAARLQSLASPDQIVIGPATQRLAGAAFEYEDLGPRQLKGVLEPMHAYRVIRAGDIEGRFDARHGTHLTPLVGRDEEIAMLMRRWTGQSHVTMLNLNRLPRRQIAAMIARVTGGRAIPQALIDQIVAKTNGVPLFVEELTKATLESGMFRLDGDEYVLSGPLTSLAIPSTLQDSLMARLDRLSEVREVAQIGACIGRDFSYELLTALDLFPDTRLQAALDALTSSELVFNRGTPPNAIYTFKHALIQDAAYASLLNSRRQFLHGLIARTLETKFAQRYANAPHVIAHHYTATGANEQAIGYWLAAGEQAAQRYANAEAVSYMQTGLRLLEQLPAGAERDRLELPLQMTLGHALGATGYTPLEVGRTFARARELCQTVGETPQMMPILFGLWIYYVMRAEFADSRAIADQILSLATRIDSRVDLLLGNYCVSGTALFIGDFQASLKHAQKGVEDYRHDTDGQLGLTYGFSFGPCCYDWASIAHWMLGFPDRSAAQGKLAIDLSRTLNHPITSATVMVHQALWCMMKGDVGGSESAASEAVGIASKAGVLIRQIEAEMVTGWALSQRGQAEKGIAEIERCLALWHQIGAHIADPLWFGMLADAYLVAARLDDASRALADGLAAADQYGEHWWSAELTRRQGDIALARSQSDEREAESHFAKAIALAKAGSCRAIELRAANSLAALWQRQGRSAQARELLEPVYAWFTEGFDTKELCEAKVLLKELSA